MTTHTLQEQIQTTSNDLWNIEQIINEGQTEEAIKKLNQLEIDENNYSEKEFLLGYANRLSNNQNVAIQHFLKANSSAFQHLPAAEEAVQSLCNNGYLREAKYFIKQITSKLKEGNSVFHSDLDRIYSHIEGIKNKTS